MIRIRLFGRGDLIQNGLGTAQYARTLVFDDILQVMQIRLVSDGCSRASSSGSVDGLSWRFWHIGRPYMFIFYFGPLLG